MPRIENGTAISFVKSNGSLRPAIGLTNAVNQGGALVGPALAGLVIARVGQGWAFGMNALVCLAVVALFAAIRPAARMPALERGPGQVREGFRFVAERAPLLWVVVLAGLMGALGLNGPVVLSAFADRVWHTGAWGFGIYNSAGAVGAIIGVTVAARLPRLRVRTVVIGAGLFAIAETVAAAMPTQAAFIGMLAVVGAATMFFLTSAATFVQLAAEPSVRGRVLAIYSPVLLGGHAFGGLLQGWLAQELGVRAGLALTGALALAATSAVGLALILRAGDQNTAPDQISSATERSASRPADDLTAAVLSPVTGDEVAAGVSDLRRGHVLLPHSRCVCDGQPQRRDRDICPRGVGGEVEPRV